MLAKLSFRQLLFAGFLFIALLLSGTSVHALLTLERLTKQSRAVAHQAVQLTEDAQKLAERTVAMERSARQYLVLDDTAFRDIFFDAWQEARNALQALTQAIPDLPQQQVTDWNTQSELAWQVLQEGRQGGKNKLHHNQQELSQAFVRLPEINDQLALAGKREIERRNDQSLSELERQRRLLSGLVAGAMIIAILLALSFGLWLSRPLAQVEVAIERLGENRFDQAIAVSGPADIRKLGRQLDWLRQRLADLEADKARFLRHISHELKTPLAALREGVALLEDEVAGSLSDNQREIARILRQNTASLQTQIEDLLRYNAAEFDAQHLQRTPVNLVQLLHTVIDDQRLQWQARSLQVDVDEKGEARNIVADAEKLGVVLANLLSNAVRFSPSGGAIHFALLYADTGVRIDCMDQGPGVAAADAARIFEPFYQGARQPSGARSGNGIGLSIVQEYIAAHGGQVQLLPANAGAHFRIDLPYEFHLR
ncbi:sensor histidine kinase [Undibacterium terreum]|uniref:histidine kinase n=1 Tax=Undibacterium terreum TaxID=1224302 RepID=A0A916V1E2_9BURK|nr:ATP-binding protein [Undibacterium terreum]GGC96108.1 two-component sensor histidine kinase [Undibacterium terreum]